MDGGLGRIGLLQDKMASLNFKYIWGEVVPNTMSADRAGWTVYGSASWTYVQRTLL